MRDYSSTLRNAGLRITEPRLAPLRTAQESGRPGVEALRQGVIDQIDSVSVQAAHDIIRALTTTGLLCEVRSVGAVTYYEINRNDDRHHTTCRSCGGIEGIPCAKGEKPCLHASCIHGYTINEAEAVCRDCYSDRQVKRRKQQTRKSAFAQSKRTTIHVSSPANASA